MANKSFFVFFLFAKIISPQESEHFKKKIILGKLQFRDIPFNGMKANQFSLMNTTLKFMHDSFPDFCDI